MYIYALVIWTIVAATPQKEYYDWRPIASFRGEKICKDSAKLLDLAETRYRCIKIEPGT
jgi:hypothetical protein